MADDRCPCCHTFLPEDPDDAPFCFDCGIYFNELASDCDNARHGPPEYDSYDDDADQAEDHAAAQRELSAIEAEEAHDAAGEAWQASAYPSGVTDPAETSRPRGMP